MAGPKRGPERAGRPAGQSRQHVVFACKAGKNDNSVSFLLPNHVWCGGAHFAPSEGKTLW